MTEKNKPSVERSSVLPRLPPSLQGQDTNQCPSMDAYCLNSIPLKSGCLAGLAIAPRRGKVHWALRGKPLRVAQKRLGWQVLLAEVSAGLA